jgi:hypothetical protein
MKEQVAFERDMKRGSILAVFYTASCSRGYVE